MTDPRGFLITWTCYGSWLWGDRRGSVDDEHNSVGAPYLPVSGERVNALRQRLTHPPYLLNPIARRLVDETVSLHCDRRGWELLAVNARSNHVHVVVGFGGMTAEIMMGEWKAWCSRRLRERGLVAPGRPVWTRHGSTRYLWKPSELEPAARYVLEGQDSERFGD